MASTSKPSASAEWTAMTGLLRYAIETRNIRDCLYVRYWLKLISSSASTPIVTISVVGGVKFYVHKTVLTQNSTYFDKALNGCFLEGTTKSINFDDIDAETFGNYVNVLYQAVLTREFTLHDMKVSSGSQTYYSSQLKYLLRFWQLADRFLDPKMKAVAENCIDLRLGHFSVSSWNEYYECSATKTKHLVNRFGNLQHAFSFCKLMNIPYQDQLVTALANCPPQVFAEHVEPLNEDFKTAVTKAFALRFVGCQASKDTVKTKKMVFAKKRKLSENSE